jgi:spore germination protein KA
VVAVNIRQKLDKIFGYNGPPSVEPFSLKETESEKLLASDGDIKGDVAKNDQPAKQPVKPKKLGRAAKTNKARKDPWIFQSNLGENKKSIQTIFHVPLNKDLIIRDFSLGGESGVKAFLVFMDGMADKNVINSSILKPLMFLTKLAPCDYQGFNIFKKLLHSYLPNNQVKEIDDLKDAVNEIIAGSTVIFLDRCTKALSVETKGFEARSVNTARTEQVVQGPQEGFVENIRANISLIRKILHSENLITEFLYVGERSKSRVAIMYMADLASPQLINEVKRRISSIKTDYLPETGMLDEMIEDNPLSIIPQIIRTERPDRVAASLVEGRVSILVDNNPFVIIVPVTFFSFLHSSEDYYVRFSYGFWLRVLRIGAIFITLLLPALYISIATFHQEMLPTGLVLSISAARERVPFPTIVEMLLMELSFELIREAGIRVPGVVGQTLSIVGTLILGQAVVAASIVSPILVIIVALTGLASFAIPNYEAAFGFRFMRFIFIFLAATLGFFGISTGLYVMLCWILSMKSFGVPFLAPVPRTAAPSGDVIVRKPLWSMEQRPDFLQPQDVQRQPEISRGWIKNNPTTSKNVKPEGEEND